MLRAPAGNDASGSRRLDRGTAPRAPAGERPSTVLVAFVLALLVVLGYTPTLGHGFVWDDHQQILDNPHLRSWASLPDLLSGDLARLIHGPHERGNYYRPLFLVHYLVNYQLFGSAPFGWHLLALVHHWLASLAAWWFAGRLGLGRWQALAVAALFVLHPAHGESVAWVGAAFNDPPVATLTFVCLGAFLGWCRGGPRWLLFAATLAYLAALGFKESAIAILVLAPLVRGLAAPQTSVRRRLVAAAPFLAVTAGYLLARVAALGTLSAHLPGTPGWLAFLPTVVRALGSYLRLLLWPWGYAPSYPLRLVTDWMDVAVWGSLAAVAGVAWLASRASRQQPLLGFAALWVLVCLAPALNLRAFRPTYLVHQRYLYLAVFGLAIALVVLAGRWWRRPATRAAALTGLLALWTTALWGHLGDWRDDDTLWRRVAEVDPGNAGALAWLGQRAFETGDAEVAEGLFRRALAADPQEGRGYCNLASILHLRLRRTGEAETLYREGLARLRADDEARPGCELNLALGLLELGRQEEAIGVLAESAERPPYPPVAARFAAVLLLREGRAVEARALLAVALLRRPDDPALALMSQQLAAAEAGPATAAGP